jgi:hypothetical protein
MIKKDCGRGSRGRATALHIPGLEFKPQYHQNSKRFLKFK